MDQSKIGNKIPEAPKTSPLGFKGGVIQGFPTQKNASPNEFCDKCSGHCGDGGKCDCGHGCSGKK